MAENSSETSHKITSFSYTAQLPSPQYLASTDLTPVQPTCSQDLLQGNSITEKGDFKLTDPEIIES